MSIQCELKEFRAGPALTIRTQTHAAELPELFGKGFDIIAEYLEELGETPAGAPFAIYHNMNMQELDVEFGIPTAKELESKLHIRPSSTPSGMFAVAVHSGPYAELEPSYQTLIHWIRENEYDATGVTYEAYLNDPEQTPENELKTQIAFELKDV